MDQAQYEAEVEARRQVMIEAIVGRERHSMWSAHTLVLAGESASRVTDAVRLGLADLVGAGFEHPKMGGPFHILPAMLLLRRWESELEAEAVDLIRSFMLEGVLERGNTENHWLMYYTGNLLAAERWHDVPVFWDGRPPEAMRREATRWILGMIDRTARTGHHEYDSPGYHVEHMMPLIGLHTLAEDEHLREQVERVLTLMVADMSLEYFKGSWAGGHSREGYRENTWTRVGPIRILQHLFFGGEPFDEDNHVHHFGVPALACRFRPSVVLHDMAHDRDTPHVVKKTKAPRNTYRHVARDPGPIRKYTYMSRSFALGTSQLNLTEPGGPIDLVSWDLTWSGPKHQAKITFNHPYQSPGRFSAFLPPLPQNARRSVGGGKPYLQSIDRLFGASPFERMMQHEGTALIVNRIPEGDEAPFANLFLPNGTDWVAMDGWLLGDMGDFYVSVRVIGDYEWEHIRESRQDAIMVTNGDLIEGWLLRVLDLNPGIAIEAVEAENVDSFEAYCEQRVASDVDLDAWVGEGRVGMTTYDGHVLDLDYEGSHTVDGVPIDYEAWPLYGAPAAHAEVNSGLITFGKNAEVKVDFGIDPTSEMIPMRVIG